MTEIKAIAFYVQDKRKRQQNLNHSFEGNLDKFEVLQKLYNELEKLGVADTDYRVVVQKKNEQNFAPWFTFEFNQETGDFEIN